MFEETISNALLADTELTDLIGENVEPLTVAQDVPRPYAAYLITDREDPSPSHDGPSSIVVATYDVAVVADTYKEVAEISEHVRRILKNYSVIEGDTQVFWTRFQSTSDIEQALEAGNEKPTYLRLLTFKAMYRTT